MHTVRSMRLSKRLIMSLMLFVSVQAQFVFFAHSARSATLTPEYLFALVNNERVTHGLAALRRNARLDASAGHKAEDMVEKNYFSHSGPDGTKPWDWMTGAGYRFERAGENLAVDFIDAELTVRAWMASQGHRDNILNREFTETGVAVLPGILNGRETILIVQHFARPQTSVPVATENGPVAMPLASPPAPILAPAPTPQPAPVPAPIPQAVAAPETSETVKPVDNSQPENIVSAEPVAPEEAAIQEKTPEPLPSSPVTILRSYRLPDPIYPERGFTVFVELSEPVEQSSLYFLHRDIGLTSAGTRLVSAKIQVSHLPITLWRGSLTTLDKNGLVKNHSFILQ